MKQKDPIPGSRWRNNRSGVTSEVIRVEHRDVVLRRGKTGERKKYKQHFFLDYTEIDPSKEER